MEKSILVPCLIFGIVGIAMRTADTILSMSFSSSLSKYGGDLAVGAMTIISTASQFVTQPLQGICQGAQPIISYNLGANKLDRMKEAFFLQFKLCILFSVICWCVLLLIPQVFAGLFTTDIALTEYTAWAIKIYMAGVFAMGLQICCQHGFMALGEAKNSMLIAFLKKTILQIPLIFILPNFFENKVFAIFLAAPISDIIAAIITSTVFMKQFRKTLKMSTENHS